MMDDVSGACVWDARATIGTVDAWSVNGWMRAGGDETRSSRGGAT